MSPPTSHRGCLGFAVLLLLSRQVFAQGQVPPTPLPQSAPAPINDVVELVNGGRVEGKVLEQEPGQGVIIRDLQGHNLTLNWSAIRVVGIAGSPVVEPPPPRAPPPSRLRTEALPALVDPRPSRFFVSGSLTLALPLNYTSPTRVGTASLDGGVAMLIGLQPDLPGVYGGNWSGFAINLTSGLVYGRVSTPNAGQQLVMQQTMVTVGYQFLHLEALNPKDLIQSGVGFFVGLSDGYAFLYQYNLPGTSSSQALPTAFDQIVGLTLRLTFPTVRGPKRHLRRGELFLNILHLWGNDVTLYSIGGGVEF